LDEHLPRDSNKLFDLKTLTVSNRCPKGKAEGREIFAGKEYSFTAAKLQLAFSNLVEFLRQVAKEWVQILHAKNWEKSQL
jgi:hypothetical protein